VPEVLTEKTEPTERPVRASSAVAIRLTSGKVMPKQREGISITLKQIRACKNW
jgi:hypothetical protein